MLAPLKTNRERLAVAAERAGYRDVEEYAADVLAQAGENDVDQPWAISYRWQSARSIYHAWMPTRGWWVDIDHPDRLQAVQRASRAIPGSPDEIWSADLESADRTVTTLIAEHLRGLELDDGTRLLGIWYRSRTLVGRCYAWWDRRGDDGLAPGDDDPRLQGSTNVDAAATREIALRSLRRVTDAARSRLATSLIERCSISACLRKVARVSSSRRRARVGMAALRLHHVGDGGGLGGFDRELVLVQARSTTSMTSGPRCHGTPSSHHQGAGRTRCRPYASSTTPVVGDSAASVVTPLLLTDAHPGLTSDTRSNPSSQERACRHDVRERRSRSQRPVGYPRRSPP
ncbi:MAG TPA: hypothetical protein VGC67_05805 [Cellulomonas sp.]